MHEQRELLLKKIGQVLTAFPHIELGYVHGSFVEERDFRDIDVAVYLSEPSPPAYESFKLAMGVGREVEKITKPRFEVDVQVLNEAPIAFQYGVLSRGRLVYARSEVNRIRYAARVFSEYQDFRPVLDRFEASLLGREVTW